MRGVWTELGTGLGTGLRHMGWTHGLDIWAGHMGYKRSAHMSNPYVQIYIYIYISKNMTALSVCFDGRSAYQSLCHNPSLTC